MNNREQIAILEKDLRRVEDALNTAWLKIGSAWFQDATVDQILKGIEKPKAAREALKQAIAEARGHLEEKETLEATREEIRQKIDSAVELQKLIAERQKQLAAADQRALEIFPLVGEAAWEAFSSNADKLGEFAPLFTEITDLNAKIQEIEKKRADEADNPDKPKGFQLLIRRGMAIAEQLKYSGIVKRLQSEQAKIGKALLETDFVDRARNPHLLEVAAPAIKQLELKAKLTEEISEAKAALADIQGFLGDQKKSYRVSTPEKILAQLDSLVSTKVAARERALCQFGEAGWQVTEISGHPELGGLAETVAGLCAEKEEVQAAIARHRAALEFFETEKRLAQIDRETAALERAIQQRQRELGILGEERDHLEKKRDTLKSEAGDAISG